MEKIEVQMPLYEIRLSLTGRCNHKCIYCGPFSDGKSDNGYGDLFLDQIEELCPLLKEKGLHIQLTGGEPTLRKDLLAIIKTLTDSRINDIGITTNGSLLEKDYAKELKDAGLSSFHFHMPSLNESTFRKITSNRKKGIVDKIKGSAIFLRENGANVEFNTPVVPYNLQTLFDLEDFCYENRINLKLIEEINLVGNQITEKQITELFSDWFNKKRLIPKEITREKQYGKIYDLNGISFRVAPATKGLIEFLNGKGETILYDGRYWIGGKKGDFVFTPSYFLNPRVGNFEELKQNLNKTLDKYTHEKK